MRRSSSVKPKTAIKKETQAVYHIHLQQLQLLQAFLCPLKITTTMITAHSIQKTNLVNTWSKKDHSMDQNRTVVTREG